MALVDFSKEGAVGVITINNPPVNALSSAVTADLALAVDKAEDASVRAVVIKGGKHFAAGADINEFQAVFEGTDEGRLAGELSTTISRLESLAKPVIAAINGFALGGGLEVAMGADFRYMAQDSKVGQPEVKLGIIPGAGGTQRLARLVGWSKAKDIVFTGRSVAADEALAIGLADRVLAPDDVVSVAMEDAATFASGPTQAIAAAKAAMHRGWGQAATSGLNHELEEFQRLFQTNDAREGVAAFLEKREPGFAGD
ncbi:MAG: enoyl-CoA hydratase/isomerase family protein [Acidimicrobiia bacterium]|nr:enoyl-CoA hydratase/isomerase family protein [Acidimicrobiia bacterium]NNL29250.1 enoyl-CoA hydratase/isomerase family protein [Acidimicrobiia bacterium]